MTAIAIIGMACRFPGAASPEAYWELLASGRDTVAEAHRPELEPPAWLVAQAPSARRGGYLDALDRFEPACFRISPREAARMDPQQRLLLEVAWEALEDAGQPIAELAGTSTGVFVGVMNADFARLAARDPRQIDAQVGPGSALGIAPNRISFAFDLRGPSLAIDTLCSSSLVALHQACLSLATGEAGPIAIAGGVNAILDRTMDVFYARAGLLSRGGRCRAFDAGADGIVRGEGCGLVVLKPLARALADGDRIHAVIRGSAVNQDGRSNGLTAPNRFSQEAVLRAAYARAQRAPSEVGYVEAHGTGTLIGDPIEAAALGAVIGEGRARPCPIGSVKSNLGHLESAAGVASLIKAVLALQHRAIPPSLHVERPNPYLRLDERRLRVPASLEPWSGEPLAGVSSFGMGGTNAHIVLEGAPPIAEAPAPPRVVLVPVSARTEAALDILEARAHASLAHHAARDVAHSLGSRRDHHELRRAFVANGVHHAPTIAGRVQRGRQLTFVLADEGARDLASALEAVGLIPDAWVTDTAAADPIRIGEDGAVTVALAAARCTAREDFLQLVGELYCLGFDIAWRRLDAPGARLVSLGTYPWQRERCTSFLAPPERELAALVPVWHRAAPPTGTSEGAWCVLGEGARELAGALERAGRPCVALAEARHVAIGAGPDLAATLALVQQAVSQEVRLWLVTRGACVVDGSETLATLEAAPAWGLGRVVMNEHPARRCTLVDGETAEQLARELLANDDEREVALRGDARFVARLQHAVVTGAPPSLDPEACYLVTGGLGGVGGAAARLLVERGARRLVLTSRRPPGDEARRTILELEARGARIVVESVDVGEREAVAALLARHPVRGVIHAAGVMRPAMLEAIEPASLPGLLAAKTAGARHLHELAPPLDFFVLCSSIATLFGMPGQGAYAAANAYLDALAAHRRARGLAATSVAWTVIEGTGMAAHASTRELDQLRDRGLAPIDVAELTRALELLLGVAPPQLGVVDFVPARWTRWYPALPRLASLATEQVTTEIASPERFLLDTLGTLLADSAIDPDRPLGELGLDSLAALELRTLLRTEHGFELPGEQRIATLSVRELAKLLQVAAAPPADQVSPRDDARLEPELRFERRPRSPTRELLLTGATGFLGAFVLAELLATTDARIHCVVRGAGGPQRLARILDRYGLPALELASRVRVIEGDLTRPGLGLELAPLAHVDTIIHGGASVNFVYPYEALRADNVGGTREILRLAARLGARLHHVSTIGVFPAGTGRVLEAERSPGPEQLALGYMRAKWAAEELVHAARERGLDVSISRPGTISNHATTGAFNPDDFVCALIKGCVQLGVAPAVDVEVNLAPVDHVSKALVAVALHGGPGTYHLVGEQAIPWRELVGWVRALGYPLAEEPYLAWRSRLAAIAPDCALFPLRALFEAHDDPGWLRLPSYDAARTRELVSVPCPRIDAGYLRRAVERFVVTGFLQRPGPRNS